MVPSYDQKTKKFTAMKFTTIKVWAYKKCKELQKDLDKLHQAIEN